MVPVLVPQYDEVSFFTSASQFTYSKKKPDKPSGYRCSGQVSMCFSSQIASHLLPWAWVYMGLVQEVAEVQLQVEEAECLMDSALPL